MSAIEFTQVVSRGCGMDIHKEVVVATVRGKGIRQETRSLNTFTSSLTELREWLKSLGVTHVAMESTGVYWKPVYNVFEGHIPNVWIVNARHMKNVPGRKTDKKDSEWICQLLTAEEMLEACTGYMTDHKRYMLQRIRECNHKLQEEIAELDDRVSAILAPFGEVVERLCEIPGISTRTCEEIIAEIGLDMTVFPTAAHLCKWAGMCPGNNESAGKKNE